MKQIPKNFYRYKQLGIFTEKTIPAWLLKMHNTKDWIYWKINVLEWILKYTIFEKENGKIEEEFFLEKWDFWVAEPQKWHKIEPIWNVKIFIDFFSEKEEKIQEIENIFEKIFPEKNPHFELVELIAKQNFLWKKALDIWSWFWRNALFLALNWFDVTCFDKNFKWLLQTKNEAKEKNIEIKTVLKDLNKDKIEENFDLIISTVALQFLEKESATSLLKSMIEKTNLWWYNLIVVPINSPDLSCPINFPNLRNYIDYISLYSWWEIITSNNLIWRFHRIDENWKRIISRFATILAKKV